MQNSREMVLNGFDGKKQLRKEYLGENIVNVLKNTADFLKEQGSIKKSRL